MSKEEINGNGEEVDTETCGVKQEANVEISAVPSVYDLEELKIIFSALGKIPITLEGEGIMKLNALRGKIKNDFDIKQKNVNK